MISGMPSLLDSIFGKQSLEEVSLDEIHHVLAEFPSFNVAHYLLCKKLKLENDPAYEEETRKTALYFNNPIWLQWLLGEDILDQEGGKQDEVHIHSMPSVINDAYGPEEEEHTVNETYSEGQEDVPVVNEEFRPEPDEEVTVNEEYAHESAAVPVIHDAFENVPQTAEHPHADQEIFVEAEPEITEHFHPDQEIFVEAEPQTAEHLPAHQEVLAEPEPVVIKTEWETIVMALESGPAAIMETGFEASDFVADTEPQRVHRAVASELEDFERATEHPNTGVGYEASDFIQEINPEPSFPELTPEPEVSQIVPENDLGPAESVNESEASDFITDDQAIEEIQEAAPVSPLEFKPDREEFISEPSISHQPVSEITAQATAVFDTKKAESIVFAPYHMVDYFASQGIKLVLEEDPQDSFGKQLKSFTDWLKVMKKIPAQTISGSTDDREADRIRHFAANSIEERDILTETMAEVLAKQGMYENAIALYQKLSLIYPPKSAYFASRIEQLKASLS